MKRVRKRILYDMKKLQKIQTPVPGVSHQDTAWLPPPQEAQRKRPRPGPAQSALNSAPQGAAIQTPPPPLSPEAGSVRLSPHLSDGKKEGERRREKEGEKKETRSLVACRLPFMTKLPGKRPLDCSSNPSGEHDDF